MIYIFVNTKVIKKMFIFEKFYGVKYISLE